MESVGVKNVRALYLEQDVIILVSENVRESTKAQFREIGCQLREIKNIENPHVLGITYYEDTRKMPTDVAPTRITLNTL